MGKPKSLHVGSVHKTRSCGSVTVIEYVSVKNVTVRFNDTGTVMQVFASAIRRGDIKDKMLPSVCGVGYLGVGPHKAMLNGKKTKEYQTWKDMMVRCYSSRHHLKQPTYKGCKVCNDWHNFQSFAEWMSTQDHAGKQLDKDISAGRKMIYSPETCLFVSRKENIEESHAARFSFISPNGEVFSGINISSFSYENGLDKGAMSRVNSGKAKSHKGWMKANLSDTHRGESDDN